MLNAEDGFLEWPVEVEGAYARGPVEGRSSGRSLPEWLGLLGDWDCLVDLSGSVWRVWELSALPGEACDVVL